MAKNIRAITRQDIHPLAALLVSVFKCPPWNEDWKLTWAEERLMSIYNSFGYQGYLLEHNGYKYAAVLGRSLSFMGQLEFEIVDFFVANDVQGQGAGAQLISFLKTQLLKDGYSRINLVTIRGCRAEAFYIQHGFQQDRMTFMSCL